MTEYKNKNQTPELLAPAGNMECLKAAVNMGANAVYLSGKAFGARSFADNFGREELSEAVRYCHLRGVAVHVTVNIIVGDKELSQLKDYLKFLNDIRVDALIIQDLGVLKLAQKLKLDMQYHASTQLTVHNLAGAKIAKKLGFDRVVLSRELSYQMIKDITDNCDIETEIFVHGAMCMSYSGQCLMSSMLGGRSGNRGKCAQPCRQLYEAEGEQKYILSLKDMALIEKLNKVVGTGVTSLKIEGRMKGVAYVGCVVKSYADCLNDARGPYQDEIEIINKVFYRGGQTSGYFDYEKGRKMFAFDKPDNPYKNGSEKAAEDILKEIDENSKSFKIKINCDVRISVGENVSVRVYSHNFDTTVYSDFVVDEARSKPLTEDTVKVQLNKTGGTVFKLENINIAINGNCFVSLKELNELRRKALSDAENIILDNYLSKMAKKNCLNNKENNVLEVNNTPVVKSGFTASILNIEQFSALMDFECSTENKFDYISAPIDLIFKNIDTFITECDRIIIDSPSIIKDDIYDLYCEMLGTLKSKGFENLRVHNICGYEGHRDFNLFGSWRMNVSNSKSAQVCFKTLKFSSVMPSLELSLPQIRDVKKYAKGPIEVMAYGRAVLMTTENCIIKNMDKVKCPCDGKARYITDRLGKSFPIVRENISGNYGRCLSILLNSCPTYMADKLSDLRKNGVDMVNLSFTVEEPRYIKKICSAYFGIDYFMPAEYTRMHFYNSVI